MGEELTFNDGILICKYIYQSVIDKVLNGVIEQEEIFYRAHEMLEKLNHKCDAKRLEELLQMLDIEDLYAMI